jgi:hypothetical protein
VGRSDRRRGRRSIGTPVAEEFRFFLRSALYVLVVGIVYWFVSYEAAGTVLLLGVGLASAAFIALGLAFGRRTGAGRGGGGALGWVNRVIGFSEAPDEPAPLEGGPEIVPLASAWPILAAAGATVVGLGLVLGPWLLVPGAVLTVAALLGWLVQLTSETA